MNNLEPINMKKYVTLIALIFLGTMSCKAQTIIPIEKFEDYTSELPDGAHVKDVNNLLNKYVGTWKGVYDGKNYEFKIVKHTDVSTDRNLKFDELLIRYKITNSFGTVIATTLDQPNDHYSVMQGGSLRKSGVYVLGYNGYDSDCGQNGNVYLSTVGGATQNEMQLILLVYGEMDSDCTARAEQIIPTSWIDLTKQ